jgi:hypothetical protein
MHTIRQACFALFTLIFFLTLKKTLMVKNLTKFEKSIKVEKNCKPIVTSPET